MSTASGAWRRRALAALAFGLAATGAWLLISNLAPAGVASLEGLKLKVDRAVWLDDHLTHGGGPAMPPGMAPGMPARGQRRLSVEVSLQSLSTSPRRFAAAELALSSERRRYQPGGAEVLAGELLVGQRMTNVLFFDVPEEENELRLMWNRGDRSVAMSFIRPPPPASSKPPPVWPKDAEQLPEGDASIGRALFAGKLVCTSCHGDPGTAGAGSVGPQLGSIGREAALRVPGKGPAQYLYESILDPDAYLAPTCGSGLPCATPSEMPFYGEVLSVEEMAHLLAYLLQQRSY